MELTFDQLQAKQAELLAANPYFAATEIMIDDGAKKTDLEKALRLTGAAILVCPIIEATRTSQAGIQINLRAENVIKLIINPTRNADAEGAQIETLAAIQQILKTILAYERTGGDSFWNVPLVPINLNTFEPGLRIYDLFFEKSFVIT